MFADRIDAGRRLAARLSYLRGQDVVVVGLPRGGVPVAAEVAQALGAPIDVIVVRKLGVPRQPELGMGAIGEEGVRVLNEDVMRQAGVTAEQLAHVEAKERDELERRARAFRAGRRRVPLAGRTVVIVDDGIATGSTAKAAADVARAEGAARVILAMPVAPADWQRRLAGAADEFVAVATPDPFYAIGQFYDDFAQTTDAEVTAALEEVTIDLGGTRLGGRLTIPEHAKAVVVFAHGSGSSRHSPRNRYVAEVLNDARLATLLFDLLTPDEERDRANVFDIDLLGHRLAAATTWLRDTARVDMPVGYFGASTGAAAALWAAAEPGADPFAVVSRGGRPDLAGPRLPAVKAPTLLIVGGRDDAVLNLNRQAQEQMHSETKLEVVRGAGHLFEEPGALQQAAALARDWFAARA